VILRETGNNSALEILTTEGAEVFVDKNTIEVLKNQLNIFTKDGCYEGLSMSDEKLANDVHGYCTNGKIFQNGKFKLSEEVLRNEVVPILKRFVELLQNGSVWWNPWKPKLPNFYKERICFENNAKISLGKNMFKLTTELLHDKIILLVDPPGAGKSCCMTQLDLKLRELPFPRLVIRINLNRIQSLLKKALNEDPNQTLKFFIQKFAPYIPYSKITQLNEDLPISLYVLLDGLDEVIPLHDEPMQTILKCLLQPSQEDRVCLMFKRLVLTSRPHLQMDLELKWKVASYSLKPFTEDEQIELLVKLVNRQNVFTKSLAAWKLQELRSTGGDLMNNPLMLTLYSEVMDNQKASINFFNLYSRFIVRKHEKYVTEKCNKNLDDQDAQDHVESLMDDYDRFYSFMAVKTELNADEKVKKVLQVSREMLGKPVIEEPSITKLKKLISYGILVAEHDEVKFKHKSFSEYFYAKLFLDNNERSTNLRDMLFAFCSRNNNIGQFIALALDQRHEKQLLSKSWTQCLESDAEWSWYFTHENPQVMDNVLTHSLDYRNDPSVPRLLIRDICFTESSLFLIWIRKKNVDWVRKNVLCVNASYKNFEVCENMREVVVAMGMRRKIPFGLLSLQEVRAVFMQCTRCIQVVVGYLYSKSYKAPDFVIAAMKSKELEMTLDVEEVQNLIIQGLGQAEKDNDLEKFLKYIVSHCVTCAFILKALTHAISLDPIKTDAPVYNTFALSMKVNKLFESLGGDTVWWKPCGLASLPNHINRKVLLTREAECFQPEPVTLKKALDECRLTILIGEPESGKSEALIQLHNEIVATATSSHSIKTKDFVVRIALNQFQNNLQNLLLIEEILLNLSDLVDCIPIDANVNVYFLLDAFEEVDILLKENLFSVINSVVRLGSKTLVGGNMLKTKVVLSSRSHLKSEIERSLDGEMYCLIPPTHEEIIEWLIHEKLTTCKMFSKEDLNHYVRQIPTTLRVNLASSLSRTTDNGTSLKDPNLYSVYRDLISKKYEVFLSEKEDMSLKLLNGRRRVTQLEENHQMYYNYLALETLLASKSLTNRIMIVSLNCGAEIFAKPNEQAFNELKNIGIINGTSDQIEFHHRTFAEFFYARMILDVENTPRTLRNILVKHGFNSGANISKFVSSGYKLNIHPINSPLSSSPSRNGQLCRYETDDSYLIDHILSHSMDFKTCAIVKEILILSIYKDEYFVSWLKRMVSKSTWVRNEVFCIDDDVGVCENMKEVVAALVLSRNPPVELSDFLSETEIKEAIIKCKDVIPIAIRLKYETLSSNTPTKATLYSDSLRERISQWLSEPCQIATAVRSALCYKTNTLNNHEVNTIIED